jgi:hypothetical protein
MTVETDAIEDMNPTDDEGVSYRGTIPPERPIAVGIVEAIADVRACDVTDIEPLGDQVDLEAVSRLVETATGELRIQFAVEQATVTVDADRTVEVTSG